MQPAAEIEAADLLLDAGLAWHRQSQPPGVYGYLINIVDVEMHALRGEKEAALGALHGAVDNGWRTGWRWTIASENLASLKDVPEYQAIIARLESDMATQLEATRELPYLGEFDLRFAQNE